MAVKYDGLKVPTLIPTDTVSITDPNIYADIVGFVGHTWHPRIKIANNSDMELWFQVKPRPGASQPPRYAIETTNLGSVGANRVGEFTEWGVTCTQENAPTPGEIPSSGTLEETIYVRIEAYKDSNYTQSYGYADFEIKFVWINSDFPGWTVVEENNFDDGTAQGWNGDVDSSRYVSPPYSCHVRAGKGPPGGWSGYAILTKSFTTGSGNKAFLVFNLDQDFEEEWGGYGTRGGCHSYYEILLGGQVKYVLPRVDLKWRKIVIPFPISDSPVNITIRWYGWVPYASTAYNFVWLNFWIDNVKLIKM